MLNPATQSIDKKPYFSPSVHDYGNIRTLTKSLGTGSKNDNSTNPNSNKTQ